MESFLKLFNSAMELSCLGLYEKLQNRSERREFRYSPMLKRALDKFTLLNLTYDLFNESGEGMLPTDEFSLINVFNFEIAVLIDKLPEEYREVLNKTDWYFEESFVDIGNDYCYYCTPDLLDKLNNDRIYRKANKSPYKELELESQKFIGLLFDKNQEEYCEIRSFFEQREHVFLTNSMFLEKEYIKAFKNKYPDIFMAAYEEWHNDNEVNLKICPHCGLVLKERSDGELYCVSDICSLKSKGFSIYNEVNIINDRIWVLRLNVSRYIYYPGILEQKIKKILIDAEIEPIYWPNKDTWDFEFQFDGETWVIDAKDIKNPKVIQNDIKQKQIEGTAYKHVLYIVPNDRKKRYLEVVQKAIGDKRIRCITLAQFIEMINERIGD